MNTEHLHVPVEARLLRGDTLIGTSPVVYLGMLGMVVDAARANLPIGTQLEVELRLVAGGPPQDCRLTAVVNQHSRLGVGLTFPEPGRQGCRELQEIIYRSWSLAATASRLREGRRPTAFAWQSDHPLPKAG